MMEEDSDSKTDELLNLIRKELTAIIDENQPNEKKTAQFLSQMTDTPGPAVPVGKVNELRLAGGKKFERSLSTKTMFEKPTVGSAATSKTTNSAKKLPAITAGIGASEQTINLPNLSAATEKAERANFLENYASHGIDEDVHKMQLELKQSYELFQTIGEKLEAIDFTTLRNRISDLNLNSNERRDPNTAEMAREFEKRYIENRLNNLTGDMGNKFRRHPGEFGDIPELSAFFSACTQLEHGLNSLRKQREQSNDLEKRMCWATEIAYDRLDEIRNAVGKSPKKDF